MAAAENASPVPVVTNISGSLTVQDTRGVSHDVGSFEPVRKGETVSTGAGSLASIALAGVGRIKLGPRSAAQVFPSDKSLSLKLSGGSACVAAENGQLSIALGALNVSSSSPSTIFDIIAGPGGATLAVYRGSVKASAGATTLATAKMGEALATSAAGPAKTLSLKDVNARFAALRCPDPEVVAQALAPSATPGPAKPSGGGTGTVLGILAGLGALAAAAGHSGGGSATPGPGGLSVLPASLTFALGGSPKTFTASEANYSGVIGAAASSAAVAKVSPPAGNGPGPVTFTVTPLSPGTATIAVSDDHGGSQSVGVTVYGPLGLSTQSLSFAGTTAPQTFTATEPFYGGRMNAASSNQNVATVAPASAAGPGPAPFSVTPVGSGTATITVTDDHGSSQSVHVTVSVGSLALSASNLIFTSASSQSQTFTAAENFYLGVFNASSTVPGRAAVAPASAPGPGPATFTVFPVAAGNATINVTDDHGGLQTVSVSVYGALTVSTDSLQLSALGSDGSFTASETAYTGPISASSSNLLVASVSPPIQNGPGPVAFSVHPGNAPGNAKITVADDHGGLRTIIASVTAGSLTVNPTTIQLSGPPDSATFVASDPGATVFNASSLNPTVATVSPASQFGFGSSPPFTVTATGIGTTSITLTDNAGGAAVVSVGVGQPPLGIGRRTIEGPRRVLAPSVPPAPRPAIAADVPSLSFAGTWSMKIVTVSEPGYAGAISASSSNPSVATLAQPVGLGPRYAFAVVPKGAGAATIRFADDHGGVVLLTVVVAAPQPVTVPLGPEPGRMPFPPPSPGK